MPKARPDASIIQRGKRMWFECVSPAPGHPESPDYIEAPKPSEASRVLNEKMILHVEKYEYELARKSARI
jgi:hypothetical protein